MNTEEKIDTIYSLIIQLKKDVDILREQTNYLYKTKKCNDDIKTENLLEFIREGRQPNQNYSTYFDDDF